MKRLLMIATTLALLLPATARADWWKPVTAGEFQWMISGAFSVNNAKHMGTGKTAWNGATAPATDPAVYDIDGFENTAATVSALKAKGKRVICYLDLGAAEKYRPDFNQFPLETLGRTVGGYASERYVDYRDARVVQIMLNRISMCATKGFDAIEPDLTTSYVERNGKGLKKADAVKYMKTLSDHSRGLGMAFLAKNPNSTGDDFATLIYDMVDAVLTEECNQYNECGALDIYSGKKAVWQAEYAQTASQFCAKTNARPGWMGTRFNVNLDGSVRQPCR